MEKYYDGLLLRLPSREHPNELGEMTHQDKMFGIFKEHHQWQDILGLRTVGDLNDVIQQGHYSTLIQISEALQEKKMAQIADEITRRKGTKLVLIARPSSSGKTTTCKRLSVQLAVNGIRPVNISLDDYFVDRENTPRDEKGDYDYEHLHALNLPLFNDNSPPSSVARRWNCPATTSRQVPAVGVVRNCALARTKSSSSKASTP